MIKKGFQLVTIGSDQRYMTAASKSALNKLKKDHNKDSGKGYQFLMNYYVYMLISMSKKNISYVGYTNNLKKRIALHNMGKGAKFTRGRKWKLIYKEKIKSKKEAISREYYIKKNRALRNKIKYENLNTVTV